MCHPFAVTNPPNPAYVTLVLGLDLIDAALLPAIAIALFGGLISFASPCVLPIVPPYIAYMSGVSVGDMNETRTARRKARWCPTQISGAAGLI